MWIFNDFKEFLIFKFNDDTVVMFKKERSPELLQIQLKHLQIKWCVWCKDVVGDLNKTRLFYV